MYTFLAAESKNGASKRQILLKLFKYHNFSSSNTMKMTERQEKIVAKRNIDLDNFGSIVYKRSNIVDVVEYKKNCTCEHLKGG